MRRNLFLIAVTISPNLFGASAATVTVGEEYCHMVRIPGGWRVYDYEKLDQLKRGAGYEFRKSHSDSDEYLIAVLPSKVPGPRQAEDYSVNKFRVDLGESQRVRDAQQQDWDSAAVVTVGEGLEWTLVPQQPRQGEDYIFEQKAFPKSGPKWPAPGDDARISPDEKWIAVQSWQGSNSEDDGTIPSKLPVVDMSGRFYVDLYEVASGKKIISLDGIDRDFAAGDAPLALTFWLDSRYFIVPLGRFREKFLVCETPAAPLSEAHR